MPATDPDWSSEKTVDGTAPEADIEKDLALYKAIADTKPPKDDPPKP